MKSIGTRLPWFPWPLSLWSREQDCNDQQSMGRNSKGINEARLIAIFHFSHMLTRTVLSRRSENNQWILCYPSADLETKMMERGKGADSGFPEKHVF